MRGFVSHQAGWHRRKDTCPGIELISMSGFLVYNEKTAAKKNPYRWNIVGMKTIFYNPKGDRHVKRNPLQNLS